MSALRIVDTSVFCNIISVPGRCQEEQRAENEFTRFIEHGDRFLVPMATLYETGNHIAQSDTDRYKTAHRFAEVVRGALAGELPFQPIQPHNIEDVEAWLTDFPEQASRGIGIGDRSIISIWETMCERTPSRRVVIWAYDSHLIGYDRAPTM